MPREGKEVGQSLRQIYPRAGDRTPAGIGRPRRRCRCCRDVPLSSHTGVQSSYPYAHGHIQGKVHRDDDDVGNKQLWPKSVGAPGGVVHCHLVAGTHSELEGMGAKPGWIGLPGKNKLIIKPSRKVAPLAHGVAACREAASKCISVSPTPHPSPLGRAEREGGGGEPPYIQRRFGKIKGI